MPRLLPVLLLRVASLPAAQIANLRSPCLEDGLKSLGDLEGEMTLRAERLDRQLHSLVPSIEDPVRRHRTLDIKRCARSLRRLPELSRIDFNGVLPAPLEAKVAELLNYQNTRSALLKELSHNFDCELESCRTGFRQVIRRPDFLNGIGLASPSTQQGIARYLSADKQTLNRKGLRLEDSLLGYYVRAAAKTSPFSTFMTASFGRWRRNGAAGVVRLVPTHIASQVAVNRTALDRVIECIRGDEHLRPFFVLEVNPSTHSLSDSYQFYRSRIDPRVTIGSWHRYNEDIVTLKRSRTLDAVLALVDSHPGRTFGETLAAMEPLTSAEKAKAYLDELIRLDLLSLVLPFSEFQEDFEARLVKWLLGTATARGEQLAREVVAWENGLSGPVEDESNSRHAKVRGLTAIERQLGLAPFQGTAIYEDSMVCDPGLQLPSQLLEPVIADLAIFAKTSSVFSPLQLAKLDMGAKILKRWGPNRKVPALLAFDLFEQLQNGGDESDQTAGGEGSVIRADVVAFQEALKNIIRQTTRHEAERVTIDSGKLEVFVARAPAAIELSRSASFFLQRPFGPNEPWVVNLPGPGYGKFFSRFAGVRCNRCGTTEEIGTELRREMKALEEQNGLALLADIAGVYGSNVNLRPLLMPHTIPMPGTALGGESVNSVHVRNMVVYVDDNGCLCLEDGCSGKKVKPVHCGYLVKPWLPKLAQFLLLFGPVNAHPLPWHEMVWGDNDFRERPRLYFGELLLYRRQWRYEKARVPARGPRMSQASFYVDLNLWRRDQGIPEQVFVTADHEVLPASTKAAPVRLQTFRRKPQYICFSSPLFAHRIERILRAAERCVTFEEVYPPLDKQLLCFDQEERVSEVVAELVLD